MIEFHLDGRSGVAPYLQLIHQVRHALRLSFVTVSPEQIDRGVASIAAALRELAPGA